MEEPSRLQSIGLWRVRHDWATSVSLFTFMHRRRIWQPTSVFLPGESQRWRSLVGYCFWDHTVFGIAQSRTRLKRLSSSSSIACYVSIALEIASLGIYEGKHIMSNRWRIYLKTLQKWASLVAQIVKNLAAVQETGSWSLGWEDPLEKGMATVTSVLAWRIPWTEDPGGL